VIRGPVGFVRRQRSGGQGLVEFAIVIPVFLVILIGMVDLGRAVWANNSVANAAREAARFASVHGGSCKDLSGSFCSSSNYCPVGPAGPKTAVPSVTTACPYPSSSKQSIYDAATAQLIGGGTSSTTTACYFNPVTTTSCSGNTDGSGGNNTRGMAVTVTVSTTVPVIIPSFLGTNTVSVSATSTMLINH